VDIENITYRTDPPGPDALPIEVGPPFDARAASTFFCGATPVDDFVPKWHNVSRAISREPISSGEVPVEAGGPAMSRATEGGQVGTGTARNLKDDLAALRIERRGSHRPSPSSRGGGRPGGGGLRLLSAVLWLIPLGLVGAGGVYAYRQYDQFRPRPEVAVAMVQAMTTGEAETLLSAKGYLKSRSQARVGAKVPGRIEQIYVQEGSRVKKGQVLAVLEHNDIKAQLESRRAMLKRSEADLAEAKADLGMKDRKARRWQQLMTSGNATVDEADGYISARRMASARVAALESAIALQLSQIKETEEAIRNMHIVAPFDGTIVSKEADLGETITPGGMGGNSGRGSVLTLADLEALEVETDVAETLLSRVTIGQPAEISVSAVPGKHYRGRLRQVVPMGDRTRGTVKVKVDVLKPDEHLFPELVATVHFLPDKALKNPESDKSYLFVPKGAIVEEGGHTFAWVVDPKKMVRRRRVEVAATNDDLARVESGLKAGESVVLNPAKTLREGEAVKVAE
jgi:RND family efflux transporter MFP subunit